MCGAGASADIIQTHMPIKTKRWDDPAEADDGFRLLVTRYRPRGVSKADETWNEWLPALGPGKDLHAAIYTHRSSPIPWPSLDSGTSRIDRIHGFCSSAGRCCQ